MTETGNCDDVTKSSREDYDTVHQTFSVDYDEFDTQEVYDDITKPGSQNPIQIYHNMVIQTEYDDIVSHQSSTKNDHLAMVRSSSATNEDYVIANLNN